MDYSEISLFIELFSKVEYLLMKKSIRLDKASA